MWLLPLLIVGTTVALSVPVGFYLAWVADGRYRPPTWLGWLEQRLDTGPQGWKQYTLSMLLFNTVMFVFGYVVLALQPVLPLNPDGKTMLAPTTIFHTACSFLTNTDLQHYAGEQHLSYFSQVVVGGAGAVVSSTTLIVTWKPKSFLMLPWNGSQ
jgi:K+-transporting ATPase ATPase A chain